MGGSRCRRSRRGDFRGSLRVRARPYAVSNPMLTRSPLVHGLRALTAHWQRLIALARDPYRPERHYMRGPGPKWHAKHGEPRAAS
ncbi:conserved hypothetical protein [Bradyrhizobium sp. STM 3843]|nr:conserved hypothetical protein [Bradyrhizobium sp. STM 3843]